MKRQALWAWCGRRRILVLAVNALLLAVLSATGAHDTPLNPDDPAYLRRQYVWFQAQDQRRQQQIRKLHADFQQLDTEAQVRYTKVLQNYNAWLSRLPAADRERIVAVPSARERLDIVRDIREQEWVANLPKPYREEYARLTGDERRQRVREWRAEESENKEVWEIAQQHWAEGSGKLPTVFANEGRARIEALLTHLREDLNDAERRILDEARSDVEDHGNFIAYALIVARLTDRHQMLPGSVGPKDWAGLPAEVKEYLRNNDPNFRNQDGIPKVEELKEVRKAQGRWPGFALELTRYCQRNNLKLPVPLGDCTRDRMPPEVQTFLKTLETSKGGRPDRGADIERLRTAHGNWPDYPRLIVELAYKHSIPIPGWTLPGPQQAWERLRAGKPRLK
jgi:hypothetical protein